MPMNMNMVKPLVYNNESCRPFSTTDIPTRSQFFFPVVSFLASMMTRCLVYLLFTLCPLQLMLVVRSVYDACIYLYWGVHLVQRAMTR